MKPAAIMFILGAGVFPIIGSHAEVTAASASAGRVLGADEVTKTIEDGGRPAAQPYRMGPIQREPQTPVKLAESHVPMIASLAPTSGPIGTAVTILGSGFTPRDNNIQFHGPKDFLAGSPVSFESGTRLRFIMTPCPSHEPQCPTFFVPPGGYSVVVINAGGRSNEVLFTVTVR
jgi:hypothetical protein